jgi:ATP-dependent Clp protease ATP-binding subunit ClpC
VFEKFESDARRLVVLAQDEARLLDHGYIGTEHLLLGVLALDGPLTDALGGMGVSLDAARGEIEEVIGPGTGPPGRHLPFTPRAKAVLELSFRESLRLDHSSIRAAHVVLGLLREGEGVACQVLRRLSGDLDGVRALAEELARETEGLTLAGRGAGIELDDVTAVLTALVEAFGDEVRLTGLRVQPSGDVQVTVHLPGRPRPSVVAVHRAGGRWVVPDPSA